jgi:CHAT domain-containing protein
VGATTSTESNASTTQSDASKSGSGTGEAAKSDTNQADSGKADSAKSDASKSESGKSDDGKGAQQGSANAAGAATGNSAGAPPTTTVPAQQAAVASQQADQQSGRQALSNLVPERSGSSLAAPSVPQMQQSLTGATNLVRSGALGGGAAGSGGSGGTGGLGPQSWLPSAAEQAWQLAAAETLLARSDVGGPALLPPAFNRAAYTPAVLHVRFSEAKGGTVRPDTDAFLDLTLVPLAGEVEGRRVEVSKKEFATLLKQLYTQLSRQEPLNTTDPASASRRLHALLVAPITSALQQRGITTLLISADRGLQGVPFAALHDGRRYFGDAYAFSLTPSLALTSMDPPQRATGRLLAAGSAVFDGLAPLPLVPAELEQVGQADRKDKALNRAFTPSTLLEQAADPRYSRVHVATHAEFLPGGPAASRLYSGTVPIPLSDFVKLRRSRQGSPLDLISFSACRTALGDADSELGFAGLALQAGARSAVGTLWYVDDVATSAYFVQMYRYLEAGIPKAEALQLTRQAFGRGLVRLDGDRLVGPDGQTLLTGLTATQQRRVAAGLENPYFWAGIELLGAAW